MIFVIVGVEYDGIIMFGFFDWWCGERLCRILNGISLAVIKVVLQKKSCYEVLFNIFYE
jgi:hypothetical protein